MLPHKIPLTNLHIFNIENVLYFMYNKHKPIKTRKPKKKKYVCEAEKYFQLSYVNKVFCPNKKKKN